MKAVAFDGDDTLWHNEPLFWASTDAFVQALAPWCDDADLAQTLSAREIANLDVFGYGIKGFALSMIETAIEVSHGRVPAVVLGQLVQRAKEMLAHPVHLLPGAGQAVTQAKDRGLTVLLITKGDLFDQESKLARSGLAHLFDHVEIVSEKDPATYARLLARHGIAADQFAMVGNSVRSDIAPVLALGGWAVQVPYPNRWTHELADPPQDHPRYRRVEGLTHLWKGEWGE